MHEEKTGYFRYIKPVRRQKFRLGNLHIHMHVITEKWKEKRALIKIVTGKGNCKTGARRNLQQQFHKKVRMLSKT